MNFNTDTDEFDDDLEEDLPDSAFSLDDEEVESDDTDDSPENDSITDDEVSDPDESEDEGRRLPKKHQGAKRK